MHLSVTNMLQIYQNIRSHGDHITYSLIPSSFSKCFFLVTVTVVSEPTLGHEAGIQPVWDTSPSLGSMHTFIHHIANHLENKEEKNVDMGKTQAGASCCATMPS